MLAWTSRWPHGVIDILQPTHLKIINQNVFQKSFHPIRGDIDSEGKAEYVPSQVILFKTLQLMLVLEE